MTVEEIITDPVAFLKNGYSEVDRSSLAEFIVYEDERGKILEERTGYRLKIVSDIGGGEGEGDHVERVVAIISGEEQIAYVRFNGFYCSQEGTEWDDESFVAVRPIEVINVEYIKHDEKIPLNALSLRKDGLM